MSLEVFEKLEAKVQQAIDTITLLQMEIEELKEKADNKPPKAYREIFQYLKELAEQRESEESGE